MKRLRLALAIATTMACGLAASEELVLDQATVLDLQREMEAGRLSSVQLVSHHLERVRILDRDGLRLNAVPILNEHALDDARELDRLRARGEVLGPLHGIPVVVKDSIHVRGLPTSNGAAALSRLIADRDAVVVERLRRQGAIVLGKGNMSTMAGTLNGTSEAYGATLNPYDAGVVPGGSSSGSAVAVAAGLVPLSLGGETGGSLRVPAHCNAVVTLKPSFGTVPTEGSFPLHPFRDVIGPFARNVTDLAVMMEAITGESFVTALKHGALRGKRVGIPLQYAGGSGALWRLDPEIERSFLEVRALLGSLGATVVDVDLPSFRAYAAARAGDGQIRLPDARTIPVYGDNDPLRDLLLVRGLNDAIRYARGTPRSFEEVVLQLPESEDFSRQRYEHLAKQAAASEKVSPREAQDRLDALRAWREADFERVLNEHEIDVLVYPTLHFVAPPAGTTWEEAQKLYGGWVSNAYVEANILGAPALSVPLGFTPRGIPYNLDFLGRMGSDRELVAFAYDYERARPWTALATRLRRVPPSILKLRPRP